MKLLYVALAGLLGLAAGASDDKARVAHLNDADNKSVNHLILRRMS